MSEPPSPQHDAPASTSDSPISLDPAAKGSANLVYILYLAGLLVLITPVIGVIMAYSAREHAPGWLQTHYTNQINVFWKGVLYAVVSAALSAIAIGIWA
jgi:uncharacterized membrane protein